MLTIDHTTCKACGLCGVVCPRHVPITEGGRTSISAEREELCMKCGHCAAVCPTDSVRVEGLEAERLPEMTPLALDDVELLTLFRQRRSVRRYKNRPVPRELLERLVDAAHAAPTGTGQPSTCLLVVSDQSRIRALMEIVHQEYAKLERALRNPLARVVIRRRIGKAKLSMLDDFVMPGMHWYLRWHREGKGDEISRDCPVLLLFHGPAAEPQMNDNCSIAAFHSILMAETLGLGTCFNHLIPPIINRSTELRSMLAIPEHHEAFTAVTLGFPKYKWKRAVAHRLAEVRFLDGAHAPTATEEIPCTRRSSCA